VKDERISKEMNVVKKYVLLYVFVAAVILGLMKIIVFGFNLGLFYVEGYMIASSIILYSIVSLNRVGIYDERAELREGRIYKYGFGLIFIGGLWTHFYQILSSALTQSAIVSITNTLILIGFIVTIILLKRKGLYANYKYIEHSKSKYYLHVLLNVLLIFVVFFGIYQTVVLAINDTVDCGLAIYFMAINAYSFVMLSIEYILFSIYEKNHYDEMIDFEKRRPNLMSKNALLFQIILFIFSTFSSYVNYRMMMITAGSLSGQSGELARWSTMQTFTKIVAVDFMIISLMVSFIIYLYLVKLIGKNKLLSFFIKFSIAIFVINFIEYIFSFVLQYLSASLDSFDTFVSVITTYNQISLFISLSISIVYVVLGVLLYLKNVPFKRLFLTYSILVTLTNHLLINLLFENNLRVLFTMRFISNLIPSALILLIIGLLSYHRYQYPEQNNDITPELAFDENS
jgi:hypothetical protein